MQRSTQTYDVREVTAHFNDCLVDCSQQLLCDDLNVPLRGTLQIKKRGTDHAGIDAYISLHHQDKTGICLQDDWEQS